MIKPLTEVGLFCYFIFFFVILVFCFVLVFFYFTIHAHVLLFWKEACESKLCPLYLRTIVNMSYMYIYSLTGKVFCLFVFVFFLFILCLVVDMPSSLTKMLLCLLDKRRQLFYI